MYIEYSVPLRLFFFFSFLFTLLFIAAPLSLAWRMVLIRHIAVRGSTRAAVSNLPFFSLLFLPTFILIFLYSMHEWRFLFLFFIIIILIIIFSLRLHYLHQNRGGLLLVGPRYLTSSRTGLPQCQRKSVLLNALLKFQGLRRDSYWYWIQFTEIESTLTYYEYGYSKEKRQDGTKKIKREETPSLPVSWWLEPPSQVRVVRSVGLFGVCPPCHWHRE